MERGHSQHNPAHYASRTTQPSPQLTFSHLSRSDSQAHMPYWDPGQHWNRESFHPRTGITKDGQMNGVTAWNGMQSGIPPPPPLSASSSVPPPTFFIPPQAPASNVASVAMSLPYDPSRRRSIGAATVPAESPSMPPAYASRAMMPPSPSQPPHSTTLSPHHSGAHGPPTASPFAGVRDLANLSSTRRSGAGMSISSILDGAIDERKPLHSISKSMQPPSPGRARASSMREQHTDNFRERSPPRESALKEPRSATAAVDPGRAEMDRVANADTPHGFRAFHQAHTHNGYHMAGNGVPGRPNSQPSEHQPSSFLSEVPHRRSDDSNGAGMFRSFANNADTYGRDRPVDGGWSASHQADRSAFSSPGANKELRDVFSPAYPSKQFGTSIRDDQAPLFRSAYPQASFGAHESIEAKSQDYGETGRPTSPQPYPSIYRNGYHERPLTFEEHQRMEGARELQRTTSDPRSIFNISPELRRRGRDSPLPQAVQGARPKHIGPGGDHPSIKSEFGRMFSGLGSGVGSATPVAGHSVNGNGTPSRIVSPTRPGEHADFARSFEDEEARDASVRPPRKTGSRRPRDDLEPEKDDGRMTPSLSQRGSKRSKTVHPHHHHHHHHNSVRHHHQDSPDQQAGTYGMIRFPSHPLISTIKHHHHHHQGIHAHPPPPHHHHHQLARSSAPPLKKPNITVRNGAVLESVSKKPRKHLGSMPYKVKAADPAVMLRGNHLHYSSAPDLIPKFEGKENCTYTVRVPRWYVSRSDAELQAGESSRLESICRERRIWGSDIYTDDSDVITAAIHSGWVQGDFGLANDDLTSLDEDNTDRNRQQDTRPHSISAKPPQPISVPSGKDMHITILILPPLEEYASTHKHHILSRDWKGAEPHDGMSYMIFKLDFVDEGVADRGVGRDASSRKARIALEERKRRDAATALLMLPGIDGGINGAVRVGA